MDSLEESEFTGLELEHGTAANGGALGEAMRGDKNLKSACRRVLRAAVLGLAVAALLAAAFGAGYLVGRRTPTAGGTAVDGDPKASSCDCTAASSGMTDVRQQSPRSIRPGEQSPQPRDQTLPCQPPAPLVEQCLCHVLPPPAAAPCRPCHQQPPLPSVPRTTRLSPPSPPPPPPPPAPTPATPTTNATARQAIQRTLEQMLMVLGADFSEMNRGTRPSFVRGEVYKAFTREATLDSGDNVTWTAPQVVAAVLGGINERLLYGPFYWHGDSGDVLWAEVNSREWSIDPAAGVAVLWSDGRRDLDDSPWTVATVAHLVQVPGAGWRVSHLLRCSDFRSSRAWGRFRRVAAYHNLIGRPPGATVTPNAGSPSFSREYLLQDRLGPGFTFRDGDGTVFQKDDFIAKAVDPLAPSGTDTASDEREVHFAMGPGGEVVAWRNGGGAAVYAFDDIGVRISRVDVVGLPVDWPEGGGKR